MRFELHGFCVLTGSKRLFLNQIVAYEKDVYCGKCIGDGIGSL